MADPISISLDETRRALGRMLHLPDNLGIVLHPVTIETQPVTETLALFVRGVAGEDQVRLLVTEPLVELPFRRPGTGRLTPAMVTVALPAPGIRTVADLQEAVSAAMEGWTALFVDGAAQAILVDTAGPVTNPSGQDVNPFPGKDLC